MMLFSARFSGLVIICMSVFLSSCVNSDSDNAGDGSWPALNTSCLPLTIMGTPYSVGAFVFDSNGNILLTVDTSIQKLNRSTCALSDVSVDVHATDPLAGLTYDPSTNLIYATVGEDADSDFSIYRVIPGTGAKDVLTTLAAEANTLTIAPAGFGAYGGQLIVGTSDGNVHAVDQSQMTPIPQLIGNTGANASSLIFGTDGTLYIATGDTTVVTMTAAGTVADFATGLINVDGLAIDNAGGRLFISDYGNDQLMQATIPGGTVSMLIAANFDNGYWPSPLLFDQSGVILMGLGEGDLTIDTHTP